MPQNNNLEQKQLWCFLHFDSKIGFESHYVRNPRNQRASPWFTIGWILRQ